VDTLSRHAACASGVHGTTAQQKKPLSGPDQFLEIGAMQIKDDNFQPINIAPMDIANV